MTACLKTKKQQQQKNAQNKIIKLGDTLETEKDYQWTECVLQNQVNKCHALEPLERPTPHSARRSSPCTHSSLHTLPSELPRVHTHHCTVTLLVHPPRPHSETSLNTGKLSGSLRLAGTDFPLIPTFPYNVEVITNAIFFKMSSSLIHLLIKISPTFKSRKPFLCHPFMPHDLPPTVS